MIAPLRWRRAQLSRMPSSSVKPSTFCSRASSSNCLANSSNWLAQRVDDLCGFASSTRLDGCEALHRGACGCSKRCDRRCSAVREILDAHAHLDERAFEFAAGIGKAATRSTVCERLLDVVLAGDEGEAVDQEADHRDQRQRDDAGANRDRGACGALTGGSADPAFQASRPADGNHSEPVSESAKWLIMSEICRANPG